MSHDGSTLPRPAFGTAVPPVATDMCCSISSEAECIMRISSTQPSADENPLLHVVLLLTADTATLALTCDVCIRREGGILH